MTEKKFRPMLAATVAEVASLCWPATSSTASAPSC